MAEERWPALLDALPGLSNADKGKAFLKLLQNMPKEAPLLASVSPDVAAEAIKELLRQAGPSTGSASAGLSGAGDDQGTLCNATSLCTPEVLARISRLVHLGATIGTAVRIALYSDDNGDVIVTARHCIEEGGVCLPDLRAFGSELKFLAAKPSLDIAVFRGPRGPGFRLQQLPLRLGAPVGLLSFPLAVDEEFAAASGEAANATTMDKVPTVDAGIIAKVGTAGQMAIASINTGMPNSSGGAVLSDSDTLAGLYTSSVWHLQKIADSSRSNSGNSSSPSSSNRNSGSGSGSKPPAIERDPEAMWSSDAEEEDAVAAAAGDTAQAAELSRLNIEHKSCASVFTTAPALYQLLEDADVVPPDPVQTASQAARRRSKRLRH